MKVKLEAPITPKSVHVEVELEPNNEALQKIHDRLAIVPGFTGIAREGDRLCAIFSKKPKKVDEDKAKNLAKKPTP